METQTLVIHVRFAPDGAVVEISERPATLNPQAWFTILSNGAGSSFQAFAGGRGVFRISREALDALKATSLSGAA